MGDTLADYVDMGGGVVLCGDMFFSAELSAIVADFLSSAARRGALVVVGDPGRPFLHPACGAKLERIVEYDVPAALLNENGGMPRCACAGHRVCCR